MSKKATFTSGVMASLMAASALTTATTNTELDLTDVTQAATAIVAGEVISSQVEMDGNSPQTLVSVRVTDEIKGDTASTITVVLPGGSYRSGRFRIGETHAGLPRLFANQKNVYFLSQDTTGGAYQIVGFNQGLATIESSADGDVVRGKLTQGQAVPMAEMKALINSVEAN